MVRLGLVGAVVGVAVILAATAHASEPNYILARRPRFDLAEFWNWKFLAAPTDPRQATQHGLFYPAHGRKPAIFKVMVQGTKVARIASARALEILASHGIPTRR